MKGSLSATSLSHSFVLTVNVGNYSISAAGRDLNVGQTNALLNVTLTSRLNFNGNVSLAPTSPLGLTVSCPASPIALAANAVRIVSCTLTSNTAGTYAVSIQSSGSPGTVTLSVAFTIHVGDFSISQIPSTSINVGQSGVSLTIGLNSTFNFAGAVILVGTSSPSGLTVTCPTTGISLLANKTATALCSLSSTTAGTYGVTITGSPSPGTVSHVARVTIHVGDFTLRATGIDLNVGQTGASIHLSLNSTFNFAGSISLTGVSVAGLTVTCPSPVTLSQNSTSQPSCSLVATTPGTYAVTLTGQGSPGTASHSSAVIVHAGDFVINVVGSNLNAGQTGVSVNVTVTSRYNFAGGVTLNGSANPTSLSVVCPASPLVLTPNSTANAQCALASNTSLTYLVTVTGSGSPGNVSRSASATVHVGDFTVTTSAANLNLGQTGVAMTVILTSVNNFNGNVSLTGAATPTGLSVSCPVSPVILSSNRTVTAACSLSSTTRGAYGVTITATGVPGGSSHSSGQIVHVGDFTITAGKVSPSSINSGSVGNSTITLVGTSNFAGGVSLSIQAPAGISCSLSAPSVTLALNGTSTSILSCSSSSAKDYNVTVTGVAAVGTATHTTSPPILYHFVDFTISASVLTVTVKVGVAGTSTITITGLNNFNGTLALSATISPNTGLTCSSISPVTLPPSTGTSGLSCNGSLAGNYTVTVKAVASSLLSHSIIVSFSIQDFTITINPTVVRFHVSSSNSTKIILSGINGFSGNVTFTTTVQSGLSCASISPSTLKGSGTATLTCSSTIASNSNYLVTVTGTSGSLVRSANVTVNVWDIAISTSTIPPFVAGSPPSSTIVSVTSTGLTGVVNVTASVLPVAPGLSVTTNPLTLTLTSGATATTTLTVSSTSATPNGTYTVNLAGASDSLVRTIPLTITITGDFSISVSSSIGSFVPGSSVNSTVTIKSFGFSGNVTLVASASASGASAVLNPTSLLLTVNATKTSILTIRSPTAGNFNVTVTGSHGTLSHSAILRVTIVDFNVTANVTNLTVNSGSVGNATITVRSLNNFSGSVQLTANVGSNGVTPTLTPATVTLTGGKSANSTLTVSISSNTPIGNYIVSVNATSGGVLHQILVSVNIVDFSVTSGSSTLTMLAGRTNSTTVRITGINSFNNTVTLTGTWNPVTLNGPSLLFAPVNVTATKIGSVNSTLTISTSPFTLAVNYTLTITATSITPGGNLVHEIALTIFVRGDFALKPSTTSQGLASNSSVTITIGLNSTGFTGPVSMSSSIIPSSVGAGPTLPTASFSPLTVKLTAGGTNTTTLTLTAASNVPAGRYNVTITGTNGRLVHSTLILVTVGANFTISGTLTTPQTFDAGGSALANVTLTSTGFTGNVTLRLIVPSGLTASLSASNVTLTPGTSFTSRLTMSTTVATPARSYIVTVNATSGSIFRLTSFTLNITGNFTISSSPSTVTIAAGKSGTASTTMNSAGLNATLTLTSTVTPAPSSSTIGVIITPNHQSLGFGGSKTSTLTISTATFTLAGTYSVTITATSGSIVHSTILRVIVTGNFTIASIPSTGTVTAGTTGSSTIQIGSSGLTTDASLSASITPVVASGPTASFTPATVALTAGGTSNSTLTISTTNSTPSGNYIITITSTVGTLTHATTFSLTVASDFSISAGPLSSTSIFAGNSTTSTISLTSFGLTGSIGLSYGFSPTATGLSATLTPQSVSVTPGFLGTSTLLISTTTSTPAGVYLVNIIGTAGTTTHISQLSVTVKAEFTISAGAIVPPSFVAGNSGTSTLTLSSAGLNGTVNLSATRSSPSIAFAFHSNSIHFLPGGFGTITLTVSTNSSTPAGIYAVTVTSTSGSIVHSVTINISVTGDFILTSSQNSGTVVAGSAVVTTITVKSFGLTAGPGLSATVPSPATGLTASFSPSVIPLTPGSNGTAILTLQTIASTPAGTYAITITGTSGSLTHSQTYTITVTPDFTLTASSLSPPSIIAGNLTSSKMTVLSLGLTTRITLNVTVALSPSGLSTSLNPVFVGLTPGINGNSTLTITTTPSTPAGVYSVTVTGASGTLVHSVTLTLIVNPDFRIIAGAPSPSSFVAGGSTASAVTMNSLGFNGTVSLSATLSPTVAGFTSSFNTRNIGLTVGSTGSAILTIQSSITTPSGTYTATIVATSGSITHSASISFIVLPDFTIASSTVQPANVLAGSSASSTISLNIL